jgi:hypothetical protein
MNGGQSTANAATVLVCVAPGERVRVVPHPSGILSMPPLELHSHAKLRVTPQHAEQLYRAGQIYHPETGALPACCALRGMSMVDDAGRRIDPQADLQSIRAGGSGALEVQAWQEMQRLAAEESATRHQQYGDGEGRMQPTVTNR